jgi:acetyltransferase (GNAT) family protein
MQVTDWDISEVLPITDKAGRVYRVGFGEAGNLWAFRVFNGKMEMGESICMVEGNQLVLYNLFISDGVEEGGIRAFAGGDRKAIDYRGRGLGSELLRIVIARATGRGLGRIVGNLLPKHLSKNPRLPDWYRQFGFLVTMQNAESGTITLPLPPQSEDPENPAGPFRDV